jgi:hypothetical protein
VKRKQGRKGQEMMIIVVSEWSGGVRLAETEVRRIRRLTVCNVMYHLFGLCSVLFCCLLAIESDM